MFEVRPFIGKPIAKLSKTYRVQNGIAETVTLTGKVEGSVPIEGASISLEGGGALRLGVGTLTIRSRTNETLIWKDVPDAKSVRSKLQGFAAGAGSVNDSDVSAAEQSADRVPEGVVMSGTALQLPPIHPALEDMIYRRHAGTGEQTRSLIYRRRWVNRGDRLCSFYGMSDEEAIISPVRGLVLHEPANVGSHGVWGDILVPVGEPPPLPVSDAFRAFCNHFTMNPKIFIRKKPGKLHQTTEELLRSHIKEQNSSSYSRYELSGSAWKFEWFDEFIVDRPDIERALSNLRRTAG